MPDALGRVLSALRAAVPGADPAGGPGAGGALDGTGLAEALWLAAAMAGDRPSGPAPAAGQAPPEEPGDEAPPPAAEDAAPRGGPGKRTPAPVVPGAAAAPRAEARELHERLAGAGTRVRGHAVAAPRATGLPRALEVTRALRPWKRPWPEGRRGTLDIDATVDGYARSGELLPVFSAAPERWFDLTLVVDRSPGMRVWEETLDDFTGVLDRLGAFRTLQVRDLLFDDAGAPRPLGQLRQADGRRLVVVVSDCVAEPWRGAAVWRLLREWAATTPTALLNPLPTKLWRRGGLNLPTVRFTPAAPGAHRSRVPHEAPPAFGFAAPGGPGSPSDGAHGGAAAGAGAGTRTGAGVGTGAGARAGTGEGDVWLPVPVLSLSPHSLDRWSRAAMRGAPEGCTAVLVPPGGRLSGPPRPRAAAPSSAAAARGFLRTASPRAVRLGVLCAPFDRLSLRLLHVIRRELVPDATTADVAETVTSGLFELVPPAEADGSLELVLSEEVRAVLRERLPAHEAWQVHQALDRHVASRGDGRPGLRSVVYDTAGPRELAAERAAFARASRQTLELLGLAVPGGGTAEPGGGAPAAAGRHAPVDDGAGSAPRGTGARDMDARGSGAPGVDASHAAPGARDSAADGASRGPVEVGSTASGSTASGGDGADRSRGGTRAGTDGVEGGFPPPPEVFAGRAEVVESVRSRLIHPAGRIVWVTGAGETAAVGRSALVLHVAHRFPGERYFADLRGYSAHPVPVEAALHRLLTELGAPPGAGPHTARELAAGLREAVGDRQVLLVLDDVADPDGLTALLPVVPGLSVLATTREPDVAPRYRLGHLTAGEAVGVIAAWAGLDGGEDRAALREMTAGRVWSARTLRLLGSWIASGSAPPLPELVRVVRDLPALADDEAATLLLRVRHLPAAEREALCLFALVPTGELTRTEGWALLGGDEAGRAMLARLEAYGLLERRGAEVYRMPEVVRRSVTDGGPYGARSSGAATRLVRHHLSAAAALYEEDHPDSALADQLRVRAAGTAVEHALPVWLGNALALAAVAGRDGTPPAEDLSDLLLLLHTRGASTPYRSRFERAARALIKAGPTGMERSAVRAAAALALAQYAAGAHGEAAATLDSMPAGAWDRDAVLRGPVNRLAGRLALARGAPAEAEGLLGRSLDAYRTDGDRYGVAAASLDLAAVLTRLGRTDEVPRAVLEALGGHPDPVPHPLMRRGLLALEEALATAGRYGELLSAQEALRAQYATEGGDHRAEGLLLTRMARTLIRLGRLGEAGEAARTALGHLAGAADLEGDREEARRLLAEAGGGDAGTHGPRTIVALDTGGDHIAAGRALSLALAMSRGEGAIGPADHRMVVDEAHCLAVLPSGVPVGELVPGLARWLPDELEAAGAGPAARLAVHTGVVPERGGRIDESGLNVRLAVAMTRSAEFRSLSENYPFHSTVCLSPEAFALLGGDRAEGGRWDGGPGGDRVRRGDVGAERDGGVRTGRAGGPGGNAGGGGAGPVAGFRVHEVAEGGRAVCFVLTPQLDLSAYDAELLMAARLFGDADPDGRLMAAALRESIDSVLDPEGTGRYDPNDLDEREKALVGLRLERELRASFPGLPGFWLRLFLSGHDWAFPQAGDGGICLLVRADEEHARWSVGLLRTRPGMTVAPVHRDAPSPLTPEARRAVLWLHRSAPLRENLLLRLPERDRAAILAPVSGAERTAELFRRVRERQVPEAALRAVTRRRDNARTVREAAAVLREEGVLVVGGNRRGRELAEALRVPVPDADAYVSVRLTRRRPHHAAPSIVAGGVAWVAAGPDDPLEPLPGDLPNPRRPR
ncbi:NaeI family type II restriction endonuclease [Streptomyces fradiae]|uniref:NaeI family type II restriction endonuclease n=1 Tax=Streptomyces fradiae TaxID=1906 RepID=UPI0035BE18FB